MALLEFLTAPAPARIVAADLRLFALDGLDHVVAADARRPALSGVEGLAILDEIIGAFRRRGLRGYGQRDPLVEYKKESFALFQDMRNRIEEEIIRYLWWLRPVLEDERGEQAVPTVRAPRPAQRRPEKLNYNDPKLSRAPATTGAGERGEVGNFDGAAASGGAQPQSIGGNDAPIKTVRREEPKIGRNDPCWCGSGKKYKKCHGA